VWIWRHYWWPSNGRFWHRGWLRKTPRTDTYDSIYIKAESIDITWSCGGHPGCGPSLCRQMRHTRPSGDSASPTQKPHSADHLPLILKIVRF
jgi:hypothetical protein